MERKRRRVGLTAQVSLQPFLVTVASAEQKCCCIVQHTDELVTGVARLLFQGCYQFELVLMKDTRYNVLFRGAEGRFGSDNLHELQIISYSYFYKGNHCRLNSSLQSWEYNVSLTTLVAAKHSPRTMCGTCWITFGSLVDRRWLNLFTTKFIFSVEVALPSGSSQFLLVRKPRKPEQKWFGLANYLLHFFINIVKNCLYFSGNLENLSKSGSASQVT